MLARFSSMVLIATLLSACGPSGLIEVEVVEFTEGDHWSGDGNKTCAISYKLLNNSGVTLTRLSMTMVWRDSLGREETIVSILDDPLPSDQASQTTETQPVFGACASIQFDRFDNVLRCEAAPLSADECAARLQIRMTAEPA